MIKILWISLAAMFLSGCDYVEKNNKVFIESYKADCASRGYQNIRITYIGGLVSSYYTCM